MYLRTTVCIQSLYFNAKYKTFKNALNYNNGLVTIETLILVVGILYCLTLILELFLSRTYRIPEHFCKILKSGP